MQNLPLRTPFDGPAELASKLRDVSISLHLGHSTSVDDNYAVSEHWALGRRHSVDELNTLLGRIRDLPGYERFLLPKTYRELSAVTENGPVVVLLASKQGCEAIVLQASFAEPARVPLPSVTYNLLNALRSDLRKAQARTRDALQSVTTAPRHPGRPSSFSYDDILKELWGRVVEPIINFLCLKVSKQIFHWKQSQLKFRHPESYGE